ncbi:glycosyltransferase [Mycolicibacterium iranicum]|uniref:glycosyltransferase n=1 Tax=Mycolicibacterium iranicum TaxID=912594 RepID=UPI0004656CF2|nr:glycosyltransferase [Mycolicibacterium iranicum]
MLSFIIPTLNEHQTIERTLRCLSGYSGDHEIIVSDGNSSDDTVEICRRFTDRIVVHDEPRRQTIAEARNAGAAAARGNHLVFVDADVLVPDIDDFFRIALDVFRADDRVVALTGRYRVHPETATAADKYVFTMLGLQFWLQNNLLGIGGSGGEFQMITADAFRDVNGFDESLTAAEDMDLFRRLSRIGRTRFESRLTVYHSGRRAHAIGWRTLLWQWFSNSVSVFAFRRSASKEWTVIR